MKPGRNDPEDASCASISAVVPVLDEAGNLPRLLMRLRSVGIDEIIVADGGSVDGSLAIAENLADRVANAPRGRGAQIAAGAALARGDILWFVHADSMPGRDAREAIVAALSSPDVSLGCFRISFDAPHPLLSFYALMARIDSVLTTFGDQGFFLRREVYRAIGGAPEWPLFEDVELRRRAGKAGRVVKTHALMQASARRFLARGVLRQQALNAVLLARFLLGTPPERLARHYRANVT